MPSTTYRLSSIVPRTRLPVFGDRPSEPLRHLIADDTGEALCAVHSDAGPAALGPMTADEAVERFAVPMDGPDGDYWKDTMRDWLVTRF